MRTLATLTLSMLLCCTAMWGKGNVLFQSGQSEYTIVVPTGASTSEHTAARELQSYLQQVGGTSLPIAASSRAGHPAIHIGYDPATGAEQPAASDESYTYRMLGTDLYIWGGSQRGTLYGVYSFLENELGIRWYTSDFTHIPRRESYMLPEGLHVHQQPALPYRLTYCYESIRDNVWCARNRQNMQVTPATNEYGGLTSYWGAHTFQKLLPPNEYFSTHPEYYSLRGKKRIDNGQLCLSNPDVLRLVSERLSRYIHNNPNCWGYDVSQNDNKLYCECAECRRIEKKYGGHSGIMIWFVNQVATRIRQQYPDVLIGTLAYEYTRRPPTGIRPADNVVIRLCDIECCLMHPLDQCNQNRDFLSDIEGWKKLTDRIFAWDYMVNFHYYHLPLANHHVLNHNIQLFAKEHLMGVLELGGYDARWSDFSEMRQWISAKLLWDPTLDSDSLAHTFITDYYGQAAPDIWTYYQMVCALPTSRTHMDCHADPDTGIYTTEFRTRSMQVLRHAQQTAASDTLIHRRVSRVLAQAYYTRTLLDGAASLTDRTFLRLREIIDHDPTTMRERGQTINQYLRHHGYI